MSSSSIVVPTPGFQAKLGWIFSIYAGVFAFLFSLFWFSPASGVQFALFAAVSALVTARLAAWIANYFGRSRYGLIACLITAVLFSMVPLAFIIANTGEEFFVSPFEYMSLLRLYFAIGIFYAAPAALAATLVFHLALVVVRRRQWFVFEQRWL
jgi:hypothetical protein